METAYGDLTSDTGSLPLGPIQNSNAGGFGLLEPSLHWEHEDAMQALDLAYEGNIDEVSCHSIIAIVTAHLLLRPVFPLPIHHG